MNVSQKEVSRNDKLIALGLDDSLAKSKIDDSTLNLLYDIHVLNRKKKFQIQFKKYRIYVEKQKNPKIDKRSKEYKIILEFLNALLKVIKKKSITEITEFRNIKRK